MESGKNYMIILILNRSRKKSFRSTKRMISAVIPSITNRLNMGDVPKRIAMEMIKNLKMKVNRGTSIEVYIQDKSGYHGFKLIQIGKVKSHVEEFTCPSKLDIYLMAEGILKK